LLVIAEGNRFNTWKATNHNAIEKLVLKIYQSVSFYSRRLCQERSGLRYLRSSLYDCCGGHLFIYWKFRPKSPLMWYDMLLLAVRRLDLRDIHLSQSRIHTRSYVCCMRHLIP
jgi:hypothetical protein